MQKKENPFDIPNTEYNGDNIQIEMRKLNVCKSTKSRYFLFA